MTKKSKISIWVLFILACVAQIIAIVLYVDSVRLINLGTMDALGLIALLPLFIICAIAVLVFAIVITVIRNNVSKKIKIENLKVPMIYTLLQILSWVLFIINIVLFLLLYII